jgi:hypothetical protein
MPRGGAVGQAVLHDDADGGGNDAVGVVAVGQGQVEHVRVEIVVAMGTAVLRVGYVQVAGSAAERIAQVVQGSLRRPQAIGAAAALKTGATWIVAGALDNPRSGKIFDAGDAFRGIGPVNPRSGHGSLRALPGKYNA